MACTAPSIRCNHSLCCIDHTSLRNHRHHIHDPCNTACIPHTDHSSHCKPTRPYTSHTFHHNRHHRMRDSHNLACIPHTDHSSHCKPTRPYMHHTSLRNRHHRTRDSHMPVCTLHIAPMRCKLNRAHSARIIHHSRYRHTRVPCILGCKPALHIRQVQYISATLYTSHTSHHNRHRHKLSPHTSADTSPIACDIAHQNTSSAVRTPHNCRRNHPVRIRCFRTLARNHPPQNRHCIPLTP